MIRTVTAKKFFNLIKDQFTYGGRKYALSGQTNKESTDCLFDTYGCNWLYGTMHKYIYRYRNLARERDILKIATYSYIIWLKRGYHQSYDGSNLVINTDVYMKEKYFEKFTKQILYNLKKNPDLFDFDINHCLNNIESYLTFFSKKTFLDIEEDFLFNIFINCLYIWNKEYSKIRTHDTDTYNEKKR